MVGDKFKVYSFHTAICRKGDSLYSWQENRAKVEFLVEEDGSAIPVEVKSGSITKTHSLKVFIEKYKPLYGVVFSAKPLHVQSTNPIHYYPLYLAGKFRD